MPTYVKRADISGVVEEHGVSVASTTDAVEVRTILTEATLHFADASGYTIGETVTETDSGITGIVYWVDTGIDTVGVVDVSGEFVGEKTITGGTSTTAKVTTSVRNLLNKTAETPRFTLVLHSHAVTSTGGADPQTISLDERTEWFVVNSVVTATVTVNNDATANVLDVVAAGKERAFRNTGREVQTVYLEFSVGGSCNVIEYNGPENPFSLTR